MKTTKHDILPLPVVDDLKRLGLALRRARVARGESQAALAQRMNIAERTLRAAEKGNPRIASGTLFGLLWAVGLSGLGADLERKADAMIDRPTNIRARRSRAVDDF